MKIRDVAVRLAREPLVHFLLAGAAVFALMSGRPPDPGERRILVNEAVVGRLVDRWTMTYRRAPTQDEIDGLIRDYVTDQVYYREGLRLGLDQDDEVVIRRMRMKMIALASSDAETTTPSDAQLQKLIDANPERYAPEPNLDLEQLYLGADNEAARDLAKTLMAQLKKGKPASDALPPAPIARHFNSITPSELGEQFGDQFAAAIGKLPQAEWRGPVASGFGLHLVKINKKQAPAPPRLADIRQRVENDWRAEMISRAEDENYREMLERYDVVIERPQ